MNTEKAKTYILDRLKLELNPSLTYHCWGHTLDVLEAATRIAISEKVGSEDLKIIQTAVMFHDAGFLLSYSGHEERSCLLAKQHLPQFDFSREDIQKICSLIMATRIPQTPGNLLEQVICDADLDYLGRDDFETIGDTLYQEFLQFGILKNEEEWNRLQVRFLESHSFFTQTSIELRNAKKAENLNRVKAIVATYK